MPKRSDAQRLEGEVITKPSPLACAGCRKRHVKCDAGLPSCARCVAADLECNYTPSRRGYRGPPKRREREKACHADARPSRPSIVDQQPAAFNPWPSQPVSGTSSEPLDSGEERQDSIIHDAASLSWDSVDTHDLVTWAESAQLQPFDHEIAHQQREYDQLLDLYYSEFHAAHPILVPKACLCAHPLSRDLGLVVRFIGSHFTPSVSSESLRCVVAAEIVADSAKSATRVQSLLLYAIALHARGERDEAQTMLVLSVDMAIDIGLFRDEYATLHGRKQAVVEESLRRTWWELFVVDGMIAALRRKPSFKSNTVLADCYLPCEEVHFDQGVYSHRPLTLAEYDQRLFMEEDVHFSSFTYRIDTMRLLARVLTVIDTTDGEQVQAIDNALAGWIHHLSPAKTDIINSQGHVDEMLFQAFMMIHSANILLHLPRSNLLASLPTTAEIVCAPQNKSLAPASTHRDHANKAIIASKELANLAALRVPVHQHTPFFTCGLVLSAIVQLSTCVVRAPCAFDAPRDRIVLIIGVLKSLSRTWTISKMVLQQLQVVAAEVLQVGVRPPPASMTCSSSGDSGVGQSVAVGADGFPSGLFDDIMNDQEPPHYDFLASSFC